MSLVPWAFGRPLFNFAPSSGALGRPYVTYVPQ